METNRELRIIIAGSREFNDFSMLRDNISNIISKYNIILNRHTDLIDKIKIISGTARGADQLGEQYAKIMGYDVIKFPAEWNKYGKSAGYRRNADMAKYAIQDNNIGMLIAFWDGKSKGTKHMIDLAKRYGLEVHIIKF